MIQKDLEFYPLSIYLIKKFITNILGNTMQKKKHNILLKIPSWGLAILAAFVTAVILMILGIFIGPLIRPYEYIADASPYISYAIIISIACFYICKYNPKSFWYVPILCNPFGIISAIVEPNFWTTAMWIFICGGWVLSIIGAVSGAMVGRRASSKQN
jgi:uncharacterized membrane protein YvlD (DUF360 family)